MSTIMRGLIVAGVVALVVAMSTVLGLPSPWPVLLVAGLALAQPVRPGVLGAVLVGAVAWWLAMALRAGLLPDAVSSSVLAAVLAVVICTATAAATRERLPLWASLGGIALFAGIYEPVFAQDPTGFVADSVLALGTVVVALGVGAVVAVVASLVDQSQAQAEHVDRLIVLPVTEGVS